MSYNGKNYMEQGGGKWVIGGTLEIKEDVSTLVSDFNGLLAKLKAAGLMASS